MTPIQIGDAYRAVLRLSNTVFPYAVARNIAKLKKRLEDEIDAVADAEKAIAAKYGGTFKRDGTIVIEDPEKGEKCADELNEFRLQDDDIKLPVVDLSKYVDSIRISPADVDALEGIVTFEKGEDKNG